MILTISWLKEHLDTKYNENKIIDKLTNIGLEVESYENVSSELDSFKIARVVNAEKHPNADRLKVCDVDIGQKDTIKDEEIKQTNFNTDRFMNTIGTTINVDGKTINEQLLIDYLSEM